MKNVTPIFKWAIAHGETRISERILIKLAPELVASNHMISLAQIENNDSILLEDALYNKVRKLAEELVGETFSTQE